MTLSNQEMDQHVALICISEGTPSGELQTKGNLKARIRIKTSFMFWKKMINREINYVKGHPVELKGPQKCPTASCIIPFHMCIGIRICSSWYMFGEPCTICTFYQAKAEFAVCVVNAGSVLLTLHQL